MAKHNQLGILGEQIAVEFLKKQNYTILETNWRYQKSEIDIICKTQNQIIFVEVKTRSTDYFGKPELAVNNKKQKMMLIAANEFVEQKSIDLDIRFDIIAIIINDKNSSINHIETAFETI